MCITHSGCTSECRVNTCSPWFVFGGASNARRNRRVSSLPKQGTDNIVVMGGNVAADILFRLGRHRVLHHDQR